MKYYSSNIKSSLSLSVHFIANENSITEIQLKSNSSSPENLFWDLASTYPINQNMLNLIKNWIETYANGKQPKTALPLSLQSISSPFHFQVLTELQNIPFGTALTYQQMAIKLSNPKAARAVGNACARNPLPLVIPCHRILSQNGLGGFSGGLDIKRKLLAFEKCKFIDSHE